MHPAKSVIFFTVFSGLGLGLFNVAFLSSLTHGLSPRLDIILLVGAVFLTFGLLSSFLHLGRPQRAWRAFSQWRTSWLSREGCMAVLSYAVPAWWVLFEPSDFLAPTAIIGIVINVITIHCTAMIYASLKPIPAWHNFFTPMNYQLLSIMSGMVGASFIISLWGIRPPPMAYFIAIAAVLSAIGKLQYWKFLKSKKTNFTINEATGIKGQLSPFDPPHASQNYLMKEMVFDWARNRQNLLQNLTLLMAFIIPMAYGFSNFWLDDFAYIIVGAATCIFMAFGLCLERWLFFACAEHSVSLYYGRDKV